MTVTGRVMARLPGAGLQVMITGHPPVTSDANGYFTVSNVQPPYDAGFVADAGATAVVYLGLTRPDPTLWVPLPDDLYPPGSRTASIAGTAAGGAGFPTPANYQSQVLFVSPDASAGGGINGASGDYIISPVQWDGPGLTTGVLHALQWRADSATPGLPVAYIGYGARAGVTLVDGAALSSQDVAMTTPANGSISGAVVANGYTVFSKGVSVVFETSHAFAAFEGAGDGSPDTAFSYVTPAVPGASLALRVLARKPDPLVSGSIWADVTKTGFGTSETGVTVILPVGIDPTAPAEGATGVGAGTAFRWTPLDGAVYLIHVLPVQPHLQGAALWIVTDGTTIGLPDLSTIGFAFAGSTTWEWDVDARAPFSVDDAAGPDHLARAGDYRRVVSAYYHFTAAP
jgi:hypothetical protein